MDHAHVMTFHHHQDQSLHQKHHQILIWFSWLMVQTVLMETTTREELPLVVTRKSKKYRGVTSDSHFIIATHNSLTQWDGSLICSRMILVQTGEEKQPQLLSNSQVSKPWKNHMNQEQFECIAFIVKTRPLDCIGYKIKRMRSIEIRRMTLSCIDLPQHQDRSSVWDYRWVVFRAEGLG